MSENRENKKSKFEITEHMLVIVNKDWNRTYVATIQILNSDEGIRNYSAKCELKNSSIVGMAGDKNQLSTNMDEMATIIEDCISGETPGETPVIAGTNCCLN
jgi:hypothetical protein